jgi:DNA-binding SARP family transcriptional activator/Flp pilus assembly protein TadD
MWFGLLGPIEARADDGRSVTPSRVNVRRVLTALLVRPNETVTVDGLADAVWDAQPPVSARRNLQTYVWRLRADLPGRITTTPAGYRLSVKPGELDADAFRAGVRQARDTAQADPGHAAATMRSALALWRGPAMTDLLPHTAPLQAAAAHLDQLRTEAWEECFALELDAGRHHELIPELAEAVERERWRERLWQLYALALYRAGRQADALAAVRRLRTAMVSELGLEPGPALQDFERLALRHDPALSAGHGQPAGHRPAAGHASVQPLRHNAKPTPPRQLPPVLTDFVGRDEELTMARTALTGPAGPAAVVISGPGGAGKTTFAVRLADDLAEAYPEGSIYVDLRAKGAAPTLPTAEALELLLCQLGADPDRLPHRIEQRVAQYRARTAEGRYLIVLDDARDEPHVRDLLPAGPYCGAIITSRGVLSGLSAVDRITLGTFAESDAKSLLRRIIGGRRTAGEPDAVDSLVALCDGLPLAVRIAGARLATRPQWRIGALVELLRDEQQRLDELVAGDLQVRSALSLSYQALDIVPQRLLRRIGLLLSGEISVAPVAALMNLPTAGARLTLERLADASLLQPANEPGRFRVHSLVHVFARERLAEEPAPARIAAQARLYHWLTACAQHANRVVDSTPHRLPQLHAPGMPDFATTAAALTWLDDHRPTLVEAARGAADAGLHRHAWQLAIVVYPICQLRGRYDDWETSHTIGLAAAQRDGNRFAQATLLNQLGTLFSARGDLDTAERHYRMSLEIETSLSAGGRPGVAYTNMGGILSDRGRPAEAIEYYRLGEAHSTMEGDEPNALIALNNVSLVLAEIGRHEEAKQVLRQAIDRAQAVGDQPLTAQILDSFGEVLGRQGDYEEALKHMAQSLSICTDLDLTWGRGHVLCHMADIHDALGDVDLARHRLCQALEIFASIDVPQAAIIRERLALLGHPLTDGRAGSSP